MGLNPAMVGAVTAVTAVEEDEEEEDEEEEEEEEEGEEEGESRPISDCMTDEAMGSTAAEARRRPPKGSAGLGRSEWREEATEGSVVKENSTQSRSSM